MMNRSTIFASALLLPLAACGGGEDEVADTTFEERASAPVVVDDGSGPVPDNEVGDTQDDVEIDGQGGRPDDNMVNTDVADEEE